MRRTLSPARHVLEDASYQTRLKIDVGNINSTRLDKTKTEGRLPSLESHKRRKNSPNIAFSLPITTPITALQICSNPSHDPTS